MPEEKKVLEKISEDLSEIKNWLILSVMPDLQRTISRVLKDDESKLIYELSDGDRSSREISRELTKFGKSVTHTTVHNMWKRWSSVAIVQPSNRYEGRFKKIISLELLGIDVPKNKGDEKND